MNSSLFSSRSDEWETPRDFFQKLDAEFHFTLDPCATSENAKCAKYFTKEQNGLVQSWKNERVFCNPPYGRELPKWIKKAFDENRLSGTLVVMLLPARTDTRAFHDYIYHHSEIRFLRGRLRFSNSTNCAPFPSMIVIYQSITSMQSPFCEEGV